MANSFSLLLAIFIVCPVQVQPETELPDIEQEQQDSFLTKANNKYQSIIGSKTIHRCPFEISCSHFLTISIKNHGAIKGTALFLDRYFFRENAFIPSHYEAVIKGNRIVYRDEIPDSLISYLYTD